MDLHAPFVSLLFITVLAALVPFVVSRVRIVRLPIVVGEIAAGSLIGKSGLNLVQSTPTLDFLAGFGFAFLMFLSGLEVNFNALVTGGEGTAPRRALAGNARCRWRSSSSARQWCWRWGSGRRGPRWG